MRLQCVSRASAAACAVAFAALGLFTAPSTAQGVKPAPPSPPQTCTCPAPERTCVCPPAPQRPPSKAPPANPARSKLANFAPDLDESDEIAALSAIGRALREVADGSSYVWYRWHGRLSGVVHPTVSFADAAGRRCRHVVVILTTGLRTGRIEGIACRLEDGNWSLEG
jgi:hypothetical protein